MSKKTHWGVLAVLPLVLGGLAPALAAPQTCGPVVDGHVADVQYDDSFVVWYPTVEYERMILRVAGPCEDIERVFERGETIYFDLRDIERLQDGAYTWELRREATIDEQIQVALAKARDLGDKNAWWELWQGGYIPQGPYVDSESFEVIQGRIVPPGEEEPRQSFSDGAVENPAEGGNGLALRASILTNADGVIRNSLCVGFDCPNSPSFSDTTILLMENNTRIKFDDTSTISGFPNRDWELQANSNSSGGGSWYAINDCASSSQGGCAEDPVFKVEANARQNALYVESDGDVGIGTSNPVVRLHAVDGDTPALRLEQDGSSGFAPQTWDVAGNETTFFIRDATNGSTLPFRIQPGAPSNSIFIDSDGEVGIGTSSPQDTGGGGVGLHIRDTGGEAQLFVEEDSSTEAARNLIDMENNGTVQMRFMDDSANGDTWQLSNFDGGFNISLQGSGAIEFEVRDNGDIAASGAVVHSSSREKKSGFTPLDPQDVLQRVSQLPITSWTYKANPNSRHIGPMAEDFHAAFGLGENDTTIALGDSSGVALAAIQALYQRIEALERALEEAQGCSANGN